MPLLRNKLVYVFYLSVVVFFLVEASLRVAAPFGKSLTYFHVRTAPWLTFEHPWDVWHVPHTVTWDIKGCLKVRYASNSFGMRDKERAFHKQKFRVAVIGDSFVEGASVNDGDTFTRVLEGNIFHDKVEFLNFGVQGNFGTTQAWLLYRHLVRKFRPDLVILAFSNSNDITENSWWYWKEWDPKRKRPYLIKGKDGRYKLWRPVKEQQKNHLEWARAIKNKLLLWSFTMRYLDEVRQVMSLKTRLLGDDMKQENLYKTNPSRNWAASWETTEYALSLLHEEVKKDGSNLLIVNLVDPAQLDPAAVEELNKQSGFDILFPNKQVRAIAARLGVRYLSLYEEFVRYMKERKLQYPYFWYTCDGHWSPLGHKLAAQAIGNYLKEAGLVKEMTHH